MSAIMRLSDCIELLDARLIGEDKEIAGVGIDTRTLPEGALFVALPGPNFDGHDYIDDAEDRGASAVLVERELDTTLPQLLVEDTRIALGRLAKGWIERLQVPVIAITGSNGKTTVKEMVASILGQLGPVLATQGNLNNDLGVPLTLLRAQPDHQYAVIEMGANHPGEIAYLGSLAQPTVALVTCIGAAHLEGFGSLEDVALAKREIFSHLDQDGYALINADDAFAATLTAGTGDARQLSFGLSEGVDVRGGHIDGHFVIRLPGGVIRPRLALPGRHNQLNATAAAAVGCALDIRAEVICDGLSNLQAVPGRLEVTRLRHGVTLIDDSYNANPSSARAAIDVLNSHSGTRILVMGDMLELGEDEKSLHISLGQYARDNGVHYLMTLGDLAARVADGFGQDAEVFNDLDALLQCLAPWAERPCTILVKGSRGARMERVAAAMIATAAPARRREVCPS